MTDRLMGGYSNLKEITDIEKEILEKIKLTVESSIGKTFTKFNGINFKSQVVAGTNYHFKVETDDDILHIKVLRPLPHTNLPPQLTSYETGKKMDDLL